MYVARESCACCPPGWDAKSDDAIGRLRCPGDSRHLSFAGRSWAVVMMALTLPSNGGPGCVRDSALLCPCRSPKAHPARVLLNPVVGLALAAVFGLGLVIGASILHRPVSPSASAQMDLFASAFDARFAANFDARFAAKFDEDAKPFMQKFTTEV
jgi:hypothetical protein